VHLTLDSSKTSPAPHTFCFPFIALSLSLSLVMSVLDVCLDDSLHLLLLVAVLNIMLYMMPCLHFDSWWYKICSALDLGVLLKSAIETAVGPTDPHWPQDAGTNLFITVSFTLFFYVLAPNIWGCVFLLVGLLSVQSFWNSVYAEIQEFATNSLGIIIDHTHVSWAKGVIVFIVIFLVTVWMFFSIPVVRLLSMCIVTAIKLVMALKVIWIVLIQGDQICCAANTDAAYCPFWMSKLMWILAAVLAVLRIPPTRYMQSREMSCCCNSKAAYQPVATDVQPVTTSSKRLAQDSSDDEETKPSNCKASKLRIISIGKPQIPVNWQRKTARAAQ